MAVVHAQMPRSPAVSPYGQKFSSPITQHRECAPFFQKICLMAAFLLVCLISVEASTTYLGLVVGITDGDTLKTLIDE
jgi:hypothetical protein